MAHEDYALMAPVVSKSPRTIDHMIAIDTEDDTHGNLRVACLYGSYLKRLHSKKEVVEVNETFHERADLIRFLTDLKTPGQNFAPCLLVGFNFSYDMPYIDELMDYETIIFSGARFITGELKNGIKVIDIFNHGGGKSLEEWITELNLNEKGIFKTKFHKKMRIEELTSHCQNDVRAHWEVADFFRRTFLDVGVSFKYTTSSVALDLFKRKFLSDIWRRKKATFNDLERKAYYGGRTEVFSRGVHRVKSYDINSAYVSVMASEYYPKPDTAQFINSDRHFRHYLNNRKYLMIVNCTVLAPKSRVMVLPYRDEASGKLLFPYGKFTGSWCSPELAEAEKYGYRILKVHNYIFYRIKNKYFENYANFTWEQRQLAAAEGNSGMKTVWKLFGNALYGKMAQRNPVGGHFSRDLPAVNTGDKPIIHTAFDGVNWYSVQSTVKEESANSFPCISAFITCYTRLKLLDYLKRHENDVIYCDTDCVKLPWDGKLEKGSSQLGDVKYEADQSGWYCFLKPKLYGKVPKSFIDLPPDYNFITPVKGFQPRLMTATRDKWHIKGVGRYDFGYFSLDTMEFHASYQKPNRFKESIRRGLKINDWTTHDKTLTIIDDKRNWIGKDSEPLRIMEKKK